MKVCLPSRTLTKFAPTNSVRSALNGLTTLALSILLTANCFGQFVASGQDASEQEHSILMRGGAQFDSVEPHQSGSRPKAYYLPQKIANSNDAPATDTQAVASDAGGAGFVLSSSQPDRVEQDSQVRSQSSKGVRRLPTGKLRPANFSADQASAFSPRQAPVARSNKEIAPLPMERTTRQPRKTRIDSDVIVDRSVAPASYAAPVQGFQSQPRRSFQSLQPRQQSSGQANRSDVRRNQAAQNPSQNQRRSSPKKTSSSAKVLISKFGFDTSQGNSDNLVPLRLADVLNQGQMRANRGQLIDQYWETFDDWAQSVISKRHRDWVNGLQVSKSNDQSTIGVAKSNAENEVTSNRIHLGRSQAKLSSVLGTRTAIVPADLPTVTLVKTNFQAFKERGLVPARLEGIDQTLNDLHDLILSRADTVLLAERTAEQVKGYYQSNQATIEQLLGAGRAWRSAESDFVSSTIEYNKAYADYALALPYGRAPVDQVVAMLVVPTKVTPSAGLPNTRQAQASSTTVRPASSNRSASQRRVSSPQTGRDSRIRAASNGFGRSSIPQPRQSGPLPDFSDSSNSSAATASFASPKTPEFRPNSVASRPSAPPASQRTASPVSASFGGGSAGPAVSAGARENVNAASAGFGGGGRAAARPASRPAAQPVSQPVAQAPARPPARPSTSGFGGGTKTAPSFSGGSANRSSVDFGSRANSATKRPTVDPFSSRPAAAQPASQPAVKPSTSFDVGGSATKSSPAGVNARDGFTSGFGR